MNTFIRRVMRENWRPGRAALAGLLATAAYSLAMEADMSITGNRYSDVRFIQGFLERKSPRQVALQQIEDFVDQPSGNVRS